MGAKVRPTQLQRQLVELQSIGPRVADMLGDKWSAPMEPAPATELARVEDTLGKSLPRDYHGFLSRHNGWKYLADIQLFSTKELLDEDLQCSLCEPGDKQIGALGGIWIGQRYEEDTMYYLAPATSAQQPILRVHCATLVSRHSFTELLDTLVEEFRDTVSNS